MHKGFTLIELLVVIAIVAVLTTVVILTLNPRELLRQSRDASRLSDLGTLRKAISIYLADVRTPNLATRGYTNCYTSFVTASSNCGMFTNAYTPTSTASVAVDGTGWLPVNFTQISSGAPIGNLPEDPTDDVNYYYGYAATGTSNVFEINARMESDRYSASGTKDVVSTDGGNNNTLYEVGTDPGLDL